MNNSIRQCLAYLKERIPTPLFAEYERRHDRLDVRAAVMKLLGWLSERRANKLARDRCELDSRFASTRILEELTSATDLSELFRISEGSLQFRDNVPADERRMIEEFVRQNYEPFFDEELI